MPEECAVMPPAISPRSSRRALRQPSEVSWNSTAAPTTPPPITMASKVSAIGSAIERRAAFPLGQMAAIVVPLRRLESDIGVRVRLAQGLFQHRRRLQGAQRVQEVERQRGGAGRFVPLGVHVDVEALAGI